MIKCYYCSNEFEDDDMRPYGPNRAWTCYDCGTLPENAETTKAMCYAAFNEAIDASSDGVIAIGEHTGPRPMNVRSLV